jgi:hypothetical protein
MASSLETDIRHVLRLGQIGKTMTHRHATKSTIAGDVARSPQAVVDGRMTPTK